MTPQDSPFYLLFGRHPHLPINLIFQTHSRTPATKTNYPQYVKQWQNAMEEAYQVARNKINEKGNKTKKAYYRWVRSSVLEPGDRVLVRNLGERGGPGKLRSFWEPRCPRHSQAKGGDSPVYEVKSEKFGSKIRVLHRNLLLPCNYCLTNSPQQTRKRPTTVIPRQTRQQPPKPVVQPPVVEELLDNPSRRQLLLETLATPMWPKIL